MATLVAELIYIIIVLLVVRKNITTIHRIRRGMTNIKTNREDYTIIKYDYNSLKDLLSDSDNSAKDDLMKLRDC